MIQKRICDHKSINDLLIYEKTMMKNCKKMTDDYADLFKSYDCELRLEYFWRNFFKGNVNLMREPFINGYEFYVAIAVVRNGKVIRYKDVEGEIDYCEIAFSWLLDTITRKWFKLSINYISDAMKTIEDDLLDFRRILDDIVNNDLEITY